uniref:Serine protease n=1 Tax=Riboviria sp. TaxID=2585031 RepID=A0A8K1U3V6_9VIRU|nr:MAG: hypothetical protein 2 [Riboviria sp.]
MNSIVQIPAPVLRYTSGIGGVVAEMPLLPTFQQVESQESVSSTISSSVLVGREVAKNTVITLGKMKWTGVVLKMGAVVMTGYLLWKLRGLLKRKLGEKLVTLGMEPNIVIEPALPKHVTMESTRAGSEETKMGPAKCQALVGSLNGSDFTVHGSAIRIEDWLVMPAHVFHHADRCVVRGRQTCLDVTDIDYVELDTDLIGLKMTPKQMSIIGLRNNPIQYDIPLSGSYVTIVGASGKGTSGAISHDSRIFGRVTYTGTTLPGYSGAPYMSGSYVFGLHTSGGVVNGGYAAGYIAILLLQLDKRRLESSEDWLQGAYQQKKSVLVDPKWNDLDEVRVRVGGRHAIVLRASMAKAFGTDWEHRLNARNQLDVEVDRSYRDYESAPIPTTVLSGEATSLKSGGSSLLTKSPSSTDLVCQDLIEEYRKLSATQRKKFRKSLNLQGLPISDQGKPAESPEN